MQVQLPNLEPRLYFDLGSPYAYLALERADAVLGCPPQLVPVLLGAIFQWRGSGSWSLTSRRAEGMRELEQRAQSYGLPPFVWPQAWPANSLVAMRAAVWAQHAGHGPQFASTVYRRQFAAGADISDRRVLAECASAVGLDPELMWSAIQTPEVKDELKRLTSAAWEAGVRGVPTLHLGDRLFYGDDRLEEAAGG